MDTADRVLSTPRLLLRPPIAADVDVVLRLHKDPLTIAHNPSDALADLAAALGSMYPRRRLRGGMVAP